MAPICVLLWRLWRTRQQNRRRLLLLPILGHPGPVFQGSVRVYVLCGWFVVLRIYVVLAIFQPYRDLEAGDNRSSETGSRTRTSCSRSQELNQYIFTAPVLFAIFVHLGTRVHLKRSTLYLPLLWQNCCFLACLNLRYFKGSQYNTCHHKTSNKTKHGPWSWNFIQGVQGLKSRLINPTSQQSRPSFLW